MLRQLWCISSAMLLALGSVASACDFCGHDHAGVSFCPWSAACPDGYNTADDSSPPDAFVLQNNGWTSTASGSSSLGAPATITWSIVPDGTVLPRGVGEPLSNSNLRQSLDDLFNGGMSPGGADLTQRTWFPLFQSAFDRWSQVAGITYVYEPNDDGQSVPNFAGLLGVRGDHRIGGHFIDGDVRPSVLAYNYYPNTSDMVIDTSEVTIFGNPQNNYLRFRQTLMHEIGHGLGIAHVESNSHAILMEPTLDVTFEGPQFDDILAAHRLYGDIYEKGVGNQTFLTATDLGPVSLQQSILIGEDAVDQRVEMADVDFVSIDATGDTDFYKFTITAPLRIDLELTPLGPTYNQGPQGGTQTSFNAAALSNLTLALFGTDGISMLAFANGTGIGQPEILLDQHLFDAGTYYVRVMGLQNVAQMYQLNVTAVPEPSALGILLLGVAGLVGGVARRRIG
jgi:serralysin